MIKKIVFFTCALVFYTLAGYGQINETFDSGIPADWTVVDNNNSGAGDGNTWKKPWSGGNIYVNQSENKNDDWLILPQIKVEEGTTFYFNAKGGTSDIEYFNIKISKTGKDIDNFTVTLSENVVVPTKYDYTKFKYDIAANENINIGDDIYVAIQVITKLSSSFLKPAKLTIDDLFLGKYVKSTENDINQFYIIDNAYNPLNIGDAIINTSNHTVEATVPYEVGVVNLTPYYALSELATIKDHDPNAKVDFTTPHKVVVVAEDGTEQEWTITVNRAAASNECKLNQFRFPGKQTGDGVIDQDAGTITIEVKYGTDVTSLTPTILRSNFATVTPEGAVDFSTNPTEFTVTAQDGVTKKVYSVTVNVKAASTDCDIVGVTVNEQVGVAEILSESNTINITVRETTDLTKITPVITTSANATVAPNSGVESDFSAGGIKYTVTAEDATTSKEWTINVSKEAPQVAITELSEGFESGVPSSWYVNNTNNDSYTWSVSSTENNNTPKSLSARCASGNADGELLVLPKVKITKGMKLKFFAKSYYDFYRQKVKVLVSKGNRYEVSEFSILLNEIEDIPAEYESYIIPLEANENINENDEVYIAIQAGYSSGNSLHKVYLDDVSLVEQSNEANLLASSITGQTRNAEIDQTNKTVSLEIPYGESLTSLTPGFMISPWATISPSGAQDFSSGVVKYTITAEDGVTTSEWDVSVTNKAASSENDITSVSVDGIIGVANIDNVTHKVTIEVLPSLALNNIATTIEVSEFATVDPISGSNVDYSSGAKEFTVSAQNGTPQVWTIEVKHPEPDVAVETISESFTSEIPSTWFAINNNSDSKEWGYNDFYGDSDNDDKGCAYIKGISSGSDDYLITPKIKVKSGSLLSFSVALYHPNFTRSMKVVASKSSKYTADDFTVTLKEFDITSQNHTAHQIMLTDIAGINAGDDIYIAFVDNSVRGSSMFRIYLDNVDVSIKKSTASELTAFEIAGQVGESKFTNDTDPKTIDVVVPYAMNIDAVTPNVTVSTAATFEPAGAQNFNSPVVYTVTAEDGTTTSSWTVNVQKETPSAEAEITSVVVAGQVGPAYINSAEGKIQVIVNKTTDLQTIEPTFEFSEFTSVDKTGAQNFETGDVVYVVTAQDGSKKSWSVSIEKDAETTVLSTINETFETTDDLPNGWSTINKAETNNWKVSSTYPYEGKNGVYISKTTGQTNDDWLVSPKVKVTGETILSFYAQSSSFNPAYRENFKVMVSTTTKLKTAFNVQVAEVNQASNKWTKYTYVLADNDLIDAGDEVYVAIRSTSEDKARLHVDNFVVTASPIASVNNNLLAIESEVGLTATTGKNYKLTNIGAGTLTVNAISDLTGTAFSTSFVKEDVSLAAGESYSFGFDFAPNSVKEYNKIFIIETSAGNVSVSLRGQGNKAASAVTVIDEDFENALSAKWTILDNDKNGTTWKRRRSSMNAHEGNYSAYIGLTTNKLNDWLILPKFKVVAGSKLSFFTKGTSSQQVGKFSIKVSKTGKNTEKDFGINLVENFNVPLAWTNVEFNFDDIAEISAGDEIYIAIQAVSEAASGLILGSFSIDDLFVGKTGAESNENDIISLSINGSLENADIDYNENKVSVVMPQGSDLSSVEPVIVVSDNADYTPKGAQDFSSSSVTYTVTAQDGTTQQWVVDVKSSVLSTENDIVSLEVVGRRETIIIDNSAKTIEVVVSADADLSTLSPQLDISNGATISPASGSLVNFTSGSAVYTVTSESGADQQWTVNVSKEKFVVGLAENFDSYDEFPTEWSMVDKDGNGKAWKIHASASRGPGKGLKTSQNKDKNNDWLISPKIKVRADDYLIFHARSASSLTPEDFVVKAAKTGKNIDEDFDIVLEEVNDASSNFYFKEYRYKLADVDGINPSDLIYIAIQVVSENAMELHIDNFYVTNQPEVSFAGYDYFRSVKKVGETFSSEENYTITNTKASVLTVTGVTDLSSSPFETSFVKEDVNLNPGETYSFNFTYKPTAEGGFEKDFVINTNGGDVKIKLNGYAYTNDVYHQGFEGDYPLRGWVVDDVDKDGNNWKLHKNTDQAPDLAHTDSTVMFSESAKLSGGALIPDNWLITPKLDVKENQKLVFWARAVSDISFKEHYSVYVSETDNAIASFTDTIVKNAETVADWTKVEANLAKYSGKMIYIAFRHHNVTDQSQLVFDDMIMPAQYQPVYPDIAVGVQRLEYPLIPVSQMSANFIVRSGNVGANLTEDRNIRVTIKDTDYDETIAMENPFNRWSSDIDTVKNPFVPTKPGNYEATIKAELPNDENFEDNEVKYNFSVTKNIFARDNGNVTQIVGTTTSNEGIIGQTFKFINAAELDSVSFALYRPQIGNKLTVVVTEFTDKPGKEIASSEEITISTSTVSDVKNITVALKERLKLAPGTYFVGVKERENERMHLAVDQTVFTPNSVFLKFDNKWYAAEQWDEALKFACVLRLHLYTPSKPNMRVALNPVEYPVIPMSQAEFGFKGSVYNDGADLTTATNANFVVEHSKYNEDVALTVPFAYETTQNIASANKFKAERPMDYTATLSVSVDGDLDKSDNTATTSFEVTRTEMGRDRGTHNKSLSIAEASTIGHKFTLIKEEQLNAVKVFLKEPTVGEKFTVTVRKFTDKPGDEIAKSAEVEIESDDSKWYTVQLESPVTVSEGDFFIGVNQLTNESLNMAVDTTIYTEGSLFGKSSADWIAPTNKSDKLTLLLRAVFEEQVTGILSRNKAENISVFPNPTTDFINLDIDSEKAFDIYIYNTTGQVAREILQTTEKTHNVEGLKAGIYFVKVVTDSKTYMSKFMIVD